ncbi:MAG: hypothetical protein MHPSP_000035, partial [Paramarteilia canceri]
SVDYQIIEKLKNPLENQKLKKGYLMTTDQDEHHNQNLKLKSERFWYNKRHADWSVPYYGSKKSISKQKEYFRAVLKDQIAEKERKRYHRSLSCEGENQKTFDKMCLDLDKRNKEIKKIYLNKFSKDNKILMDMNTELRKLEKKISNENAAQVLAYNPINASGTIR